MSFIIKQLEFAALHWWHEGLDTNAKKQQQYRQMRTGQASDASVTVNTSCYFKVQIYSALYWPEKKQLKAWLLLFLFCFFAHLNCAMAKYDLVACLYVLLKSCCPNPMRCWSFWKYSTFNKIACFFFFFFCLVYCFCYNLKHLLWMKITK